MGKKRFLLNFHLKLEIEKTSIVRMVLSDSVNGGIHKCNFKIRTNIFKKILRLCSIYVVVGWFVLLCHIEERKNIIQRAFLPDSPLYAFYDVQF